MNETGTLNNEGAERLWFASKCKDSIVCKALEVVLQHSILMPAFGDTFNKLQHRLITISDQIHTLRKVNIEKALTHDMLNEGVIEYEVDELERLNVETVLPSLVPVEVSKL